MTRYFELDFDNDTVIEYTRRGECNLCGACCIAVVSFQITTKPIDRIKRDGRNGGDTPGDSGKWQAVFINGHWRFWKLTGVENLGLDRKCGMLTANNRCKIHMGKSLLSREWPMTPSHIEPFSECSYSFSELARWSIAEWYEVEQWSTQ